MQRWITVLLGVGVLGLAVWLTVQSMSPAKAKPVTLELDGASPISAPTLSFDAGDLFDLPIPSGPDTRGDAGGVGARMPDGTPVPPLPDGTPRQVRFGVILVAYAGAQGAPPTARSKKDAGELAVKLAAEARGDFHSAVRHGDDGSNDDVGHIQRGVLELAVEYLLFTLPMGKTSDPIDTPRGYWIVKRIE